MGRFISQDNHQYLQPDVINGLNLFATGGGGQIVKLANVADDISDFNKITVVGEARGGGVK